MELLRAIPGMVSGAGGTEAGTPEDHTGFFTCSRSCYTSSSRSCCVVAASRDWTVTALCADFRQGLHASLQKALVGRDYGLSLDTLISLANSLDNLEHNQQTRSVPVSCSPPRPNCSPEARRSQWTCHLLISCHPPSSANSVRWS